MEKKKKYGERLFLKDGVFSLMILLDETWCLSSVHFLSLFSFVIILKERFHFHFQVVLSFNDGCPPDYHDGHIMDPIHR